MLMKRGRKKEKLKKENHYSLCADRVNTKIEK